MKLADLLRRVPKLHRRRHTSSEHDVEIDDLAADSREVEPGTLFVAMEGPDADGHDFIREAIEHGAAAVMVERGRAETIENVSLLEADQPRRMLGTVASAFYDEPSRLLEIVGITGTNGKTTTSHMLEAIFEAAGDTVGRIGTIRHRWDGWGKEGANTTPGSLELQRLWTQMLDDDVDRAVLEVSSHALATHRMRGTYLDRAVFTNLGRDHLDFHGNMASYRRAKARLFTEVLPRSRSVGIRPEALINADDPFGRELMEELHGTTFPVRTYGVEGDAPDVYVHGTIVETSLEGTTVRMKPTGRRGFEVELPMIGAFNAQNALAAAAAALSMEVEPDAVREGLYAFEGVPGRLEPTSTDAERPYVYVDYAHTPDALEQVLSTLEPLTRGRLTVVFGCGGDRDRDKRPKMGRIADTHADRVWITSDNPRSEAPEVIIDDILEGVASETDGDTSTDVRIEPDRGRAIERAVEVADPEDVVLVAGKGHERQQEIDGEFRPFDDAERAEAALDA